MRSAALRFGLMAVLLGCSDAKRDQPIVPDTEHDRPRPLEFGELKVIAALSNPSDQYELLSRCRDGCRGGGSCDEVDQKWLCVVRCNRDDQCVAPKKCMCNNMKTCSLHLFDVFKTSNARVCLLDKLGMNSPGVQNLLRDGKR
jgi:hypothetical protein